MDTGATLVCTAIAAGLLLAWGLPRWRLRQALARPLSNTQLAIVERNVVQYRGMAVPLREQLQGLVKRFLHEKTFVGCAGLDVTEEMRVTIAAQACLLLLNRATEVYPGLHAVLVYPGASWCRASRSTPAAWSPRRARTCSANPGVTAA